MKKALILVALLVVLLPAGLVLADIAVENTKVITHTFPGPVDEIVVRSDGGDVELVPGRGTGVDVRETQHYLLREPTLERDVEGGVLSLEVRCGASFVKCSSDLRVSVPAGTTITIDSDSGDVEARAIDVGEARVQSDSGDMRIELAGRQRLVRAHTDSGDIDVVTRDARAVDATTDAGDVVVTTGAARDIDARTDSGDVVIAVRGRPRRVVAGTDAGDVRVVVPRGDYAIVAETDSGDVEVDGISRQDRAPRSVEARTHSGDVMLNGR
ncbi:MAG TPA: DUF4097 family beta strand repeat-containing protein [Solirubrobacteraceae bacterium]|nr:DUF4097 family beta strand repeat-containing protein [Solirubrobacteraceae bacterium]